MDSEGGLLAAGREASPPEFGAPLGFFLVDVYALDSFQGLGCLVFIERLAYISSFGVLFALIFCDHLCEDRLCAGVRGIRRGDGLENWEPLAFRNA